ncbi:HNH endonuclease [Methanosphaera sp. ISO3-F5]|uniref:HNH endonuclease n=1 Tax=Methanosphaera sp. ISO3-F5 TaxID=1452353 RepID=UPI002B25D048|nr:HNH endonuclease [Methanosphaera sp. ISO3-F5]WQH63695.1 HNH endonuclease [Methanosphaera sp. ISO3-F5]
MMNSRKYLQTNLWTTDIRKRDKQQCFICGSRERLQVHHIYGVKDYGFLFSDISNGITLCEKCHCKYHQLYQEVNPYTWSQFLLKNEWNATSISINYDNGTVREFPLYPTRKEMSTTKPLLNNNIRNTIIHVVQTSGFDNGVTPIDWVNMLMEDVYGIESVETEAEVQYLVKREVFEKVGKRNIRMAV